MMEIVIDHLAKEVLDSADISQYYIKLYYLRSGWCPGMQMEFAENINDHFEVFEEEGYKIAIEKDTMKRYDYFEIKYSNKAGQEGFYPHVEKNK